MWSFIHSKGIIPPARAYHASAMLDNLLLVHGGEGCRPNSVPTTVGPDRSKSVGMADHGSLYSNDNVSSVEAAILTAGRTVQGVLPGVCPGDSIQGLKLAPAFKLQQVEQDSSGIITCFDDLYACDVNTFTWYSIKTSLAPLPRKGHTLNLVRIADTMACLVFGGYSIENVTVSNTLLVCDTAKIKDYYEACKRIEEKGMRVEDFIGGAGSHGKRPANKEFDLLPVVWRTLNCRGTPPLPRYKHSSTVISGASGETLLVVIGGIGKDPSIALSDVHILNVDSLSWVEIKANKIIQSIGHLSLGVSGSADKGIGKSNTKGKGKDTESNNAVMLPGDGPMAGVFGHVAFPFTYTNSQNDRANVDDGDSNTVNEVLIFGGSYNTTAAKTSCYSQMSAYNVVTHTWRKIPIGHRYPVSRFGHTGVVVRGWAPSYDTPFAKPPQPIVSSNDSKKNSLVIFGGVTASNKTCCDTWALDLQWRPPGMEQYDDNMNEQLKSAIERLDLERKQSELQLQQQRMEESLADQESFYTGTVPSSSAQRLNNSKYLSKKLLPGTSKQQQLAHQSCNNKLMKISQSLPYLPPAITPSSTMGSKLLSSNVEGSVDMMNTYTSEDIMHATILGEEEKELYEEQLSQTQQQASSQGQDRDELILRVILRLTLFYFLLISTSAQLSMYRI